MAIPPVDDDLPGQSNRLNSASAVSSPPKRPMTYVRSLSHDVSTGKSHLFTTTNRI